MLFTLPFHLKCIGVLQNEWITRGEEKLAQSVSKNRMLVQLIILDFALE